MNNLKLTADSIKGYSFACQYGYKGSSEDYLRNVYASYCKTCLRCKVEPLDWDDWQGKQVTRPGR